MTTNLFFKTCPSCNGICITSVVSDKYFYNSNIIYEKCSKNDFNHFFQFSYFDKKLQQDNLVYKFSLFTGNYYIEYILNFNFLIRMIKLGLKDNECIKQFKFDKQPSVDVFLPEVQKFIDLTLFI